MNLAHIIDAASTGDREAQLLLAFAYENGLGVSADREESRLLLNLAATAGSLLAQQLWAIELETGALSDSNQAMHWMRKAAESGYASAQYHLGRYFECGIGTPVDRTEARHWYERAASGGFTKACTYLGTAFAEGLLGERNQDLAFQWYARAASSGDPAAASLLASCYEKGFGTVADPSKALEWFTKAAENGDPFACMQLGLAYSLGGRLGVSIDSEKGSRFLKRADELSSKG